MRLIVISAPSFFREEARLINSLFEAGLACLHLRKPHADSDLLRGLLESIEAKYHPRIALHQHYALAAEYELGGLHFSEQARLACRASELESWSNKGYRLSTSVHERAHLPLLPRCFSYVFLSPVFDSISKPGYKGIAANSFRLSGEEKRIPVIGLGGVDRQSIGALSAMNFDGAAVLGALWNEPHSALLNFKELQKYAT